MFKNLSPRRRKELITLALVFLVVLLASALAAYVIGSRLNPQPQRTTISQPPSESSPGSTRERTVVSPEGSAQDESFTERVFGIQQSEAHITGKSWAEVVAKIATRLMLAALVGAALAFRPRKRLLAMKRNPYVAETQILLAVVASALMIIVGDNAARAFGIFAAVSLVRFRTNIRDPKEITVLLICLALGLATGVGRWDLALVLAVFSLLVLWILEYREPQLVFRTMDLKITTRNVDKTQEVLREVFKKHNFDSELRALNLVTENESLGSIVYSVDVNPVVSTDQLSEEILSLDDRNIDSIEWEQKKAFSFVYQ
jgi:uncharacterized membrane protein YhiD involved in acid resistance